MLLSECHIWTLRNDVVCIKSNDLGAFRYFRQRDLNGQESDLLFQAKRDYIERRDGLAVLTNNDRSAGRLKDNIKKLEELLKVHKVVHSKWRDGSQVLLLFANGVICYLCIDIFTGDIRRMVFEKYLREKLAADTITDAFFTSTHIVLAYNTNQLTVALLQKANERVQCPEKISNMDPKIFHAIIPGATDRKLVRHLSVNCSSDLFLVWTKSSQNEVYPWRPTLRDQDRANIHVFKINGIQLESLAYCWTENDPLSVDFLRTAEGQIFTLEQKVSRKGEIAVEICSYEIIPGKMQRSSLSSVPIGAQISCFAISPDQEKLFLGTTDHRIFLHDLLQESTNCVSAIDILPTQCAWHCDSAVIVVANDRSQFQCFDLALSPILNQLTSEDVTPLNLLDLSHYFSTQTTLLSILFDAKPSLDNFSQKYAQTDSFLLFLYEGGPIGCLRFFGCAGMRGDIHNSGLTADVLVDKYLNIHQLEKAVKLLSCLNWETYGAMCLISLYKIINYIFYQMETKITKLDQIKKALSTFSNTLSEETKDQFSDQVFDLKRRCFFFLLRKELFTEAFEMACDIEDYDLFMDLFNLTKDMPTLNKLSSLAFRQAAIILHEEDRINDGNQNISTECSKFFDPSVSDLVSLPQTKLADYTPPLPTLNLKSLDIELLNIDITKSELQISTSRERRRTPPDMPMSSAIEPTSSLVKDKDVRPRKYISYKDGSSPPLLSKKVFEEDEVDTNASESHSTSRMYEVLPDYLPGSSDWNLSKLKIKPPIGDLHSPINSAHTLIKPRFYQHPLVSGHIPATSIPSTVEYNLKRNALSKKPTTSILSNSNTASVTKSPQIVKSLEGNELSKLNGKDSSYSKGYCAEKNKVKFSDTIQVAVVPEIPRRDKAPPAKRNTCVRPKQRSYLNPKKELADSLPLCHPNDEYLKDFNPTFKPIAAEFTDQRRKGDLTKRDKAKSTQSSIKVVHFGVV